MAVGKLTRRLRAVVTPWLRRDGLALLLFAGAVAAMTYPLAFRPAQGLPNPGDGIFRRDIYPAFWQVWWLGEVVKRGYNANFSPLLFHPNGLDVTFQPHPWTALGVWLPLARLLGDFAGFNVAILLGLLWSAYLAYLLVLKLTDSRVAAWVGGAFYAFYPAHVVRVLQQPTTGSIQWIPLFVLALVAGLERTATRDQPRRRLALLVLASVALSLNAYISIKPWMQALLLGALYVPLAALAEGWWRQRAFWGALGVLAACSLLFVLPVISPYVLSGSGLEQAIELKAPSAEEWNKGADVLSYFKTAPQLPLFVPRSAARLAGMEFTEWHQGRTFYVGLISSALVAVGVAGSLRRDRRRLVWLVMALVLWSLSLGVVLRVDNDLQREAWTPYQLVGGLPFFAAVRVPHRFALGFSLPWAVLVGHGVADLWRRLSGRRWLAWGAVGALSVLMLVELTEAPIPQHAITVPAFYTQLRAEPDGGAVVELPIGDDPKRNMYLQTIHGRPMSEGKIARMPPDAYAYVDANPLLSAWRDKAELTCDFDLDQAIASLRADGYRYVVVHKPGGVPNWMVDYVVGKTPVYADEKITVFELADLEGNPLCAAPTP